MNTPRTLILFSVISLSACKVADGESGDDAVDPEIAAQIDLCVEVCFKVFCDPTFEPAPGVEAECESGCTDAVAVAQDDGCTEHYQNFLECVDALPCDDYSSWWGVPVDQLCPAEVQAIDLDCPNVKVHNEAP